MALVGWWKLDGDAVDATISGFDGVVNNVSWIDGKINQAGSFDGSSSYISASAVSDYLHGRAEASISLWCKKNAIQYGFLQLSGFADTNGNLYPYQTETKVYLDVFRTDRLGPIYMPTSVLEWHHVVITQKSGEWKLYQNGELVHQAGANNTIATDYLQFEIGRNSGSRYADGLFDDVKVYDHALSLKEVKHLAQAKVAHWKFDDFQEPTINKNNTDISTWTSRNGITVSETTAVPSPVAGAKVYLAQKTADSSLLRDGGTGSGPLSPDSAIDHTFSVYARTTPGTTSTSFGIDIGDGVSASEALTDGWQRVVATGTGNATDGSRDFTDINVSGLTGNEVYLSSVQTEKKDYVTPFTEFSRDGLVKDSSGYVHDASLALSTTPRWINDTKIGVGCYGFDGSDDYIATSSPMFSMSDFTISFWAEWNDFGTSNVQFLTSSYTEQLEIHTGGGAGTNGLRFIPNTHPETVLDIANAIVDADWHHYTVVYTKNDKVVAYRDGYEIGSKTHSHINNTTANSFNIGRRNSNSYFFNGKIDDVRIYAEGLSADDIKELYQQRGSLDNTGNLYTSLLKQIGIEEEFESSSLNTSIWQTFGDSYGSIAVSNGECTITNSSGASSNVIGIASLQKFPIGMKLRARVKNTQGRHSAIIGFGVSGFNPYPHATTDIGCTWYSRADAITSVAGSYRDENGNTGSNSDVHQDLRSYQILELHRVNESTIEFYRNDILEHTVTNVLFQDLYSIYFSADGHTKPNTIVIDWIEVSSL